MLGEAEQTSPEIAAPEVKKHRRRLTLIEAALYVAGRPLDLKTLASVIKTRSPKVVQQLVRTLKEEYSCRETCLEILELEDQRFVMQLKTEYSPQVQRLAVHPLLTIGPLKTLSYIAYRQPVPQRQVLSVRGSHVYSHFKQLEERGLITRERVGRTKVLRTTQLFADYFGLSYDLRTMKRKLKKVFGSEETKPKEEEAQR